MGIEEEYSAFQRKASIALAAKQVEIDRLRGELAAADWWIIQRGRDLPDHACNECVTGGDIVVPGWQCVYHAALSRAALAEGNGQEGGV